MQQLWPGEANIFANTPDNIFTVELIAAWHTFDEFLGTNKVYLHLVWTMCFYLWEMLDKVFGERTCNKFKQLLW